MLISPVKEKKQNTQIGPYEIKLKSGYSNKTRWRETPNNEGGGKEEAHLGTSSSSYMSGAQPCAKNIFAGVSYSFSILYRLPGVLSVTPNAGLGG